MSAVRIESDAWNDWRFTALGTALYPAMDRADATDLAMLRFFRLVSQCTDRDTYFLPIEAADAICGAGFALALIACGLGEQIEEGTVRVRGTGGRIEWLAKKRKAGRKGGKVSGKSRASKGEAKAQHDAKQMLHSASPKSNPTATATATATTLLHPEETHADLPVGGGATRPPGLSSARWRELFESLYAEANAGALPTWDKRRCIAANKLLHDRGEEEVIRRTQILFRSPPAWIAAGGRDLGTLVSQWDKLATPSQSASPRPRGGGMTAAEIYASALELERQGR